MDALPIKNATRRLGAPKKVESHEKAVSAIPWKLLTRTDG